MASTKPRHVVRVQDFRDEQIMELFKLADQAKAGTLNACMRDSNKIVCSLFYEPSTRTRLSFESAARRLGCGVIGTENAAMFSSAIKGESLEDSIRVISNYCDAIVLRSTDDNAAEIAAKVSPKTSIINGGCGKGQHPTQAFLDLYTIVSKLGSVKGRSFALVGDLKNGRTVRSLAYLLGRYKGVRIHFVSQPHLRIGHDILDYLEKHNVEYHTHAKLEDVIRNIDVVYMTRLQSERMDRASPEYAHLKSKMLVLDRANASLMKPGSLILHPLPRNEELDPEVDDLPQAAYFEQAQNGLYIRMALLYMLLKDS